MEDCDGKFAEICGLATNGSGMEDQGMRVISKACLRGSSKRIYDNVFRAKKPYLETDEGPKNTYKALKFRLFQFLETSTEGQLRVRTEWNLPTKARH